MSKIIPYKVVGLRNGSGHGQVLYRFKNGYGASVIRTPYSIGSRNGQFELAVIHWTDNNDFVLDYNTPIANDVIGYLEGHEVEELLKRIIDLDEHLLPSAAQVQEQTHL